MSATTVEGDRRRGWSGRRVAPLAVAGLLLLLVVVVSVVAAARSRGASLDPDSAHPDGAGALAALLRQHGTQVQRYELDQLASAGTPPGGPGGVVFLPQAEALPTDQVTAAVGASPGALVVLGAPTDEQLRALPLPISVGHGHDVTARAPGCAAPAPGAAGAVELGGSGYAVHGPATTCYPAGGEPTYVDVTAAGTRFVVLGDPSLFTNAHLARQGNAALALSVLAGHGPVRWFLPSPAFQGAPAGSQPPGLLELLPGWVRWAALQLVLALVLLALWRGRRLGGAVTEPLPVVVPAAEAVEGKARLYRSARARGRAAAALRAATVRRLCGALGLPAGAAPGAVTDAAAGRVGREPGAVGALLYGAPPADDAGLVSLADQLDALETEVRRP